MNADAGVVQDQPAIEIEDGGARWRPIQKNPRALLKVERNAEVPGKVIESTQRKHSKEFAGRQDKLCNPANSSIASARHYHLAVGRSSYLSNAVDLVSLRHCNVKGL